MRFMTVIAVLAMAFAGCTGAGASSSDARAADSATLDAAEGDAVDGVMPHLDASEESSSEAGAADVGAPEAGAADAETPEAGGSTVAYSTDFYVAEAVLSEGGHWHHGCSFFTTVSVSGGNAYGTSSSGGRGYVDSYAYLQGFPPDQRASAVIHKGAAGGYMEVELLLRWSDTANSARGYEVYLHQDGLYLTIMRWSGGPLSDVATIDYFQEIAHLDNLTAPKDGDVYAAQIVGNTITVSLAGKTLLTADVSKLDGQTYPDGNPGIGFDLGRSGAETADANFGFQSFSATGLP